MTNDTTNEPAVEDDQADTATRTRVRVRAGRSDTQTPAGDDTPDDTSSEQADSRRRTRPRTGAGRKRATAEPAEAPSAEAEEPAADEPTADAEPVINAVEVPGALDEPEVDIEVEPTGDGEPAVMLRRRRRRRSAEPETAVAPEPPLPDASLPEAEVDAADDAGVAIAELDDAEPEAPEAAAQADAEVDAAADAEVDAAAEADVEVEEADDAADADEDASARPARRRRRGGRGRGRRARVAAADADAGVELDSAEAEGPGSPHDSAEPATDSKVAAPSTRLAARDRGRGRRAERGPAGLGARGGRRPVTTVSEETRRAIADAPPKRMLVTVGQQRTQVAVLEGRDLGEHYVTRRDDVSYVGNIYLGRIQNVLPGMEAAFVDIGKGRNGVLYAGEVNYDEADLEGELPRIEQTLKPGQTVLVQVTKDPMGTKGARLTQQLSIAGRYCVLAPNDAMLGISRKLPEDERERLRKVLKSIKPEDYGLIVRTAAEGATREQLEEDVERLVRIWEQVSARAAEVQPLEAVYEEPELVIRVIRDVFGPDFTDLIVDDDVLAQQIRGYLADVSPELMERVSVHAGEDALFDGYEVTNQIRRALEKKVWLASGGYLIIEKTEAMWVIDVNTGKFVGKSNLEETVLRNNLEAATEIARQLRLRDMGGIIVIDFVDMLVPANRDEVLKRFKRELARDKTKSRVMEISKLGLIQMTRKNVSQGLNESFTTVCECCEGRGAQIVEKMLG